MKKILPAIMAACLLLGAPLSSAEETNYRTPESFTDEEYRALVSGKKDYSLCLRDEALKVLNQYADVRQIADIAMQSCQKTLDEMDTLMASKNYHPEFRKTYITRTRNSSAKVMVPEIMRLKATGG